MVAGSVYICVGVGVGVGTGTGTGTGTEMAFVSKGAPIIAVCDDAPPIPS